MIDPNSVRLVPSVPQPVSGQPLQQAVLGSGHYVAEEFRFLASKVAGIASERFTTIGVVSTGPGEGKTTVALGLTAARARISHHRPRSGRQHHPPGRAGGRLSLRTGSLHGRGRSHRPG